MMMQCSCHVNYAEPEWDCASDDLESLILFNTGIRAEIQPSYEVYTMPSRTLFFSDLPETGEDGSENDRTLKDDTKAYTIIPKMDITVHWSTFR